MVQTKVNTANAFQILADSTPKERFRRVIMEARKRIMDGESISQGFANFPQVFDGVYIAIVQASETSGQLPIALRERSKALKRSDKVLRKLKNAMIYPVIVLLMALGAVMVFSIMAVPALSNLYKGTGVELPLVTRIIVIGVRVHGGPYLCRPRPRGGFARRPARSRRDHAVWRGSARPRINE